MDSVLLVFKCGQKVAIKFNHDVDGIITAQLLRFERAVYEISYFNNGEYKQIWLDESEFTAINGEKQKIGFK